MFFQFFSDHFAEGPSCVILSVAPENASPVPELARRAEVAAKTCGRVGSGTLRVVYNGVELLSLRTAEVFEARDREMESWFHK